MSGLALGLPEMKDILGKGKSFVVPSADAYGIMGEIAHLHDARGRFPVNDYSTKGAGNGKMG